MTGALLREVTMGAAGYVSRVGGLAVALGLGVAVATGYGVASADDMSGPDSSDSQPSVPADAQAGSSTTNSPVTGSSTGTTRSTQSPTSTSTKTSKRGRFDLGSTLRRYVDRGVAVSTAGALSGAKTSKDGDKNPAEKPAEAEENEVVGSEGPQGNVLPAPTPVATLRTDTDATKSSSRLEVTSAQAPVRTPAQASPVRAAEVVVDKVAEKAFAVKEALDVIVHRAAADTVVSMTSAVQAPAMPMQAASPVEQPAPATENAVPVTVQRVVSGVLAAIGFTPMAGNSPLAPVEPVALVALLAWGSRRESEQSFSSLGTAATPASSTPVATAARTAAPVAAAALTTPVTTRVGWLTGANSINDTVKRFGIAGTDVGVMWDNGITGDNPATTIVEQRQVLMAFGDTFSGPGMTGTWRMNTLLRSADPVLSDGLYVPDGIIHDPGAYSGSPMTYPNFSREIIGNYHYGIGPEVTMIPTAGISVPGAGVNGATRQYVNFMAVRSWDSPGRWTTNYSAIAYSDDNGQNWTVVPASSVRTAAAGRATVPYVSGNQNFQQGAYVKPPVGSPEAAAGWVYSYGTPAGRGGTAYLSRVNQNDILDQTKYEYWNGSTWVKNKPSAATPILPGTTKSSFFGLIKTTTYPTVGEMSVQYNPYLKKYVMLYADNNNNVVMRTADKPQGTWSAPKTLVTSTQYPGLYAPMIHPWSGTDQLKKPDGTPEDPQYLYWGLSQWNEYNVALMRTDLNRV